MNQIAIGIDIGGTNTKFGLIGKAGEIYAENSIPTQAEGNFEDFVKILHIQIQKLLNQLDFEYQLLGVGVGAPNANYFSGRIENAPNLKWGQSVELVKIIEQEFKLPAVTTNDANASALGEYYFGDAKEMNDFLVITLGTGVGSGLYVNGGLVYGADGFAGEFGHITVVQDGRTCGCGKKGCIEAYCSAGGVVRTLKELLEKEENSNSILKNYDLETITTEDIYKAALLGDKLANKTFEISGKLLGETLANYVTLLRPEAIFMLGGLANAKDIIFPIILEHMNLNVLSLFKDKVKLLPSGMPKNFAALVGTAALIWDKYNEK